MHFFCRRKIDHKELDTYHKHETNCEIMYIIKGKGKVRYENELIEIKEGQAHYCPKGHYHCLINDSDSDLYFFAVVCEQ